MLFIHYYVRIIGGTGRCAPAEWLKVFLSLHKYLVWRLCCSSFYSATQTVASLLLLLSSTLWHLSVALLVLTSRQDAHMQWHKETQHQGYAACVGREILAVFLRTISSSIDPVSMARRSWLMKFGGKLPCMILNNAVCPVVWKYSVCSVFF